MARCGDGQTGPTTVLAAAGSHLYPGSRGTVRGTGGGPVRGTGGGGACMVEFADGSAAFGRLCEAPEGWALALDGYTTARGTAIPPKRWRVQLGNDGGGVGFRVTARLS